MTTADAATRAKSLLGATLVERYRLEMVLGAGPSAALFRAMDARDGTVALKIFYPEFMRGDAGRRFLRESNALSMLRHPHLVETLGAGTDVQLGLSFLVRGLLAARSVEQVGSELGVLDPVAAVRIALQAARGVNAAHHVGILHRSLKPENLFLESRRDEQVLVRVADFGCLRLAEDTGTPSHGPTPPPGPPDYLAPEQFDATGALDERVDVWGLGAVLYELLSGSPPFGHLEQTSDVVFAIVRDDVPHLQDRAPWVSAELALVVHRALSRDPAARFATMEDFAGALRPLGAGDELLTVRAIATVPAGVRSAIAARADLHSQPPPAASVRPRAKQVDEHGLVGQRLDGRFRVLRLVARGGMGAVYEVEDPSGQRLAAKVISRGLAGENHPALERFAREAKAASVISSPNVVRTLDAGADEALGLPYIIMELLHGTDFSSLLKREGALEPSVAVRIVLQSARGIAAAHAKSVVHRDIKPANLFLAFGRDQGEVTVKVCDFGVAKRTRMEDGRARTSGLSLTRTGGMIGSPMYMSPEQARNAKHVDERADVWSLAVVLWEALTGARLWGQQTSLGELIVSIVTDPIRRVDEVAPWVPHELARIVHRGLERDLAQRTPDMRTFIASLEALTGGSERIDATELVGLSDERRAVLLQRSAAAPARHDGVTGAHPPTLHPPPESLRVAPPHAASAGSRSWLFVLALLALLAVAAAATLAWLR